MDPNSLFSFGRRRRLVNLGFRPLLQLKLPFLLLLTTALFTLLFMAHTSAAYGKLVAIGLQHEGLRNLADEIRYDFFVVSISIAVAYSLLILGICLASAHRLLGPIIALQRHFIRLQNGDFSARVHLRTGHPLTMVANELNALTERLGQEDSLELETELLDAEGAIADHAVVPAGPRVESAERQPATKIRPSAPWFGWYARPSSSA